MREDRNLMLLGSNSPRLQIEYVPFAALNLNASNPRKHSEKQITNIAKNMVKCGSYQAGVQILNNSHERSNRYRPINLQGSLALCPVR